MLIPRLKFLGNLAITAIILLVAMWMSPERDKFLPFKGIHQAVSQNRLNTQQQQQRRIALVIGNANYEVGKLKTPLNDAADMAATLKKLGFQVILLEDASKREMQESFENFSKQLSKGTVGLFYYAGHGMQVQGKNYLIPVNNTSIYGEADIEYDAVPLGKILQRMESADNGANIVILDACRDNPFSGFWKASSQGLADVQSGIGTLIAFATAPEMVSSDGGKGRNSLFTSYLLKYIGTPNLDVDLMLRLVREDVLKATNNYQVPWNSSSLRQEFSFNPFNSTVEQGNGQIIIYSTAQGRFAEEGKERNSPFTSNLLRYITVPEDIEFVLRKVRDSVVKETNNSQVPWWSSSLSGGFSFNSLSSSGVETHNRKALVIGNANYEEGQLQNSLNDAKDIAEALRKLRFEVILVQNLDLRSMEAAINDFSRQLRKGGVGVFYYAGHGVQVEEENYLIPLNAKLLNEKDLRYKAVALGKVLNAMEAAENGINGVNIVILDACRDNPFYRFYR
jgi:uncharacterized caspase-like protein